MTERSPYVRAGNCANCGRSKAAHVAEVCPTHTGIFTSLDLPEGKTCGDCVHLKHLCSTIYGRIAGDQSCDWFLIRFLERTQ